MYAAASEQRNTAVHHGSNPVCRWGPTRGALTIAAAIASHERLLAQKTVPDRRHGASMRIESLVGRESAGVPGQPLITAGGNLPHRDALHEIEHRQRRDGPRVPARRQYGIHPEQVI